MEWVPLFQSLGVPILALILFLVKRWITKNDEFEKLKEARMSRLEDQLAEISKALDVANLKEIRERQEELRDHQEANQMKIDVLWRYYQGPKRT